MEEEVVAAGQTWEQSKHHPRNWPLSRRWKNALIISITGFLRWVQHWQQLQAQSADLSATLAVPLALLFSFQLHLSFDKNLASRPAKLSR